jgi:DNA-binding transcriptional regulator YdaS (Cro superfamily)
MKDLDPKIPIETALEKTDGNQAALGRLLMVERASVNGWIREKRKYLPPLQGHRFVRLFGDVSDS